MFVSSFPSTHCPVLSLGGLRLQRFIQTALKFCCISHWLKLYSYKFVQLWMIYRWTDANEETEQTNLKFFHSSSLSVNNTVLLLHIVHDSEFKSSLCVFLEDIFVLETKDPQNPSIYGVFSTSRWGRVQPCSHLHVFISQRPFFINEFFT